MSKALGVILIAGLLGCAGNPPAPPKDDEGRIEYLRALYEQEEYDAVILGLKQFLADRPGSRFCRRSHTSHRQGLLRTGTRLLTPRSSSSASFESFPGERLPLTRPITWVSPFCLSPARRLWTRPKPGLLWLSSGAFVNRYPDHELAARAKIHIGNIRDKLAEKGIPERPYLRETSLRPCGQILF